METLEPLSVDPRILPLPDWLPEEVRHYVAHTELGAPIRALARNAGCHASTVMRQIRRIEVRRDDPLIDAALRDLGKTRRPASRSPLLKENPPMTLAHPTDIPDERLLEREAKRVLRRMCETGAVLAVAADMDQGVVVRDTADGGTARTAVVSTGIARAMALKDWIAGSDTGRILRYQITPTGRAALARLLKEAGETLPVASGFADAQASFDGPDTDNGMPVRGPGRRIRYGLAESPLSALARRRDSKGKPFLGADMVQAGERLREDFELAQMGQRVTQNWDRFLTGGAAAPRATDPDDAPARARARVEAALADLGPGLSDVVLRCCCYLEGLEAAEKRLGWSARSGKIVLRIALMRLHRHYEATTGPGGPMIG